MAGKVYLGDAVFATIEHGMLKLTTEDGIDTTNVIYLEPAVLIALLDYIERLRAAAEPHCEGV